MFDFIMVPYYIILKIFCQHTLNILNEVLKIIKIIS